MLALIWLALTLSTGTVHAQGNVYPYMPPATARGTVEFSYMGFYPPSNLPWFSTLQSACVSNAAYLSGLRDMWAGAYCLETHLDPGNSGYWIASIAFPNWPSWRLVVETEAVYTRAVCPSGYNNGTFTWDEATSPRSMVVICSRSGHACPANSTGAPATDPAICTCNANYVPDAAQTSCVEQDTLALTPAYATIEPGKTYTFTATVAKQGGGAPDGLVPVSVQVAVDPASGGHDHGETYAIRDKGSVSPAAGNASFPVTFTSTAVSGTHTITATCDLCVNNTATATVEVKVPGLWPIPAYSQWYALRDSAGKVIGAVPGKHSDNHYLTGAAITKLKTLANVYAQINNGQPLYLNDASLIWGGLFDARDFNWKPPHKGHRLGTGLDIRAANSGPNNEGAVPATLFDELSKGAAKEKIKAELHCTQGKLSHIGAACNGIPNNRHFHADF